MTETLKPCPLCHSIDVYMTRNPSGLPHSVICRKCGCDAPWISWNARAPGGVAQIVAWLEKRAYYLEADFPQAQQALIDAADAIERGDWKDK